jgi:hypothetical protein
MAETPLETTLLGKTGLDITCVGFGAWAIGGGAREFGWGPSTTTSPSPGSIAHSSRASTGSTQRPPDDSGIPKSRWVARSQVCPSASTPYVFTKASLVEGGVIVCSPVASDLLTGAMTRERIACLPDDDRHPTIPGAVAVARALHNPAVDGANRRPDDADLSMIDGRTAR